METRPEVVKEKDDLYATALESDLEKPFFDDDQDEPCPPITYEVVVESDQNHGETCSKLETEQESSPGNFL